jgi:long-chain acyl-CoA synthetase
VNIGRYLIDAAHRYPHRPAVTQADTTLDYRTFERLSAGIARHLAARGVVQGDRVAVLMGNTPELLAAMFATFRLGAELVPCNARATRPEVEFILEDCSASVLITDTTRSHIGRDVAFGGWHWCIDDEPAEPAQADDIIPLVATDPSDVAWIFYTSGTTGHPKGALLTHSALNFMTVGWLADLSPMDERDVTLHAAPLSHGAGFHAVAATARGAHQVMTPRGGFDPVETLRLIDRWKVTNTWLVPTQIIRLTDVPHAARMTTSLQYVVYGGAPMSASALSNALDAFGKIFVQLYAQGETPMTLSVLKREHHVPELLASAGKPRLGIEVRIVDENDRDLGVDEIGEIVVRGPTVMVGYLGRPDATAETLRDGWLHTGDLGRIDAEQNIFVLDRSKDLIISGGANVYAVEVEAVLSSIPGVVEAAVVGVPDAVWGERVEAVVVPGEDPVDAAELDRICRSCLSDYKIPRRYHIAESLPRNAYGKILKRELRAHLQGS